MSSATAVPVVEQNAPPPASARSARSEGRLIEMLRRRHERRRRLFPRAIVVGLCAGLVASFFRAGVERGEELRGERELRAGDRLQVVIAPEAADAVGLLRVGVGLDRHAGD